MSNDTPTETAEPKSDLLTNYFLGVVNIGLFFTLLYLLNQSIDGLCFGALWFVAYTGYVFGSAILFVVEDNFSSVKSIRAYYLNRYIILLFETGLILFAILLVLGLVGVSQINEGINWKGVPWNIIDFFFALYVLSSLISIVAVAFSILSFGIRHYCDPDYNPIARSESSKQTNSSPIIRSRNAFWQFVIDVWRQFAIFTLWITFPLLLLVENFLEDLIKLGDLDFGVLVMIPLIIGSVKIQIAYIVFNVVMRRLYAWIGNRIAGSERGTRSLT